MTTHSDHTNMSVTVLCVQSVGGQQEEETAQTVQNCTLLITWPPSHVLLQPARREEPCNCVDQAIYTTNTNSLLGPNAENVPNEKETSVTMDTDDSLCKKM